MPKMLIGLYDSLDDARSARDALLANGIAADRIRTHSATTGIRISRSRRIVGSLVSSDACSAVSPARRPAWKSTKHMPDEAEHSLLLNWQMTMTWFGYVRSWSAADL